MPEEWGTMMEQKNTENMRALVTIASPVLVDVVKIICAGAGVEIRYEVDGAGTASQEWMDLLGLQSAEKKILISILPKEKADDMVQKLGASLPLKKPGTGIVFTLEAVKMMSYAQCMQKGILEGEAKCWLVSVVTRSGCSGMVMDAARTLGATGGTVIRGSQIRNQAIARAWGLHHPGEKEIVLILSEPSRALELMGAIEAQCGEEAEAKTFAQPADLAEGLEYYLH